MAILYFRVSAQYDEVIRLRKECEKLEAQLKKMDVNKSPAAAKALETQLASARQQMMGLVTEAAKAGAEIENGFKKKIYDASQTVNGLSEKIIAQRAVIKDIEFDVKRLGDAYRTALKRNPIGASGKLDEYNAARKALDEEKAVLFGLTQQQAEARLSVKKLRDEYSLYKKEAGETVDVTKQIKQAVTDMGKKFLGGYGIKELVSQIVRVRGEFQSMQTAIETMVGKDMADSLMSQLKEMAKISPLTLTDMVDAEKMILGFNIQAEDTVRYLQALSDISMGDSVKFKSLTLAFSQMSAAGKLMGQDLNQMINAGFNPLQIIAEKTGKSISTLKDEMSKGAVSAEMVQQAFIDATSAGGKFYQMSENASKTINGQLSMMQDALDNAFNEMGQASEGVIMEGIQLTTTLIQNYETVGKVLVGLVATYGTYRTAVMLATAATSKHTIAEIALTNARVLARKAQMALNAAMLTNPYVAVATVVAGLAATIWALHDSSTETEKAQKRLNERQQQAQKEAEEHKRKIDALIESSRDIALTDLQRGQSLAELRKEYPKIFSQYDIESIKLADILKLKQQIAEEDARRVGEKQKQDFANLENEITYYENLLKSLSSQQGVDGYVKKLKELRAERDILLKERSKGISEQFISSLKEMDISEFDRYISKLEKRIKGKGESGKIKMRLPIDVKGSLSDEALFEVKDIKTLIDTAKSTKQSRIDANKNQTTYQQDLASAKADWEKAKKGYETLIKDQKATSEQVKKAREEMEAKEKAYKELGGDVDKKKQIKESSPFPKLEQFFAQDLQKRVDSAEQETTEAVNDMVQTMLNGLDSEQEAMYKYLRDYGTFRERQKAIIEEYSKKIADVGGADTWQGKLLSKEMDTLLSDLQVEALKTTSAISGLFGDMKDKTLKDLQEIGERGKEALEFLKSGEWNEEKGLEFGLTKEQFETISKSPEKLKDISDALRDNKRAAEELRPAYDKVADGLKKVFNSGNDTKKLKEGLSDIQNGMNDIMRLGSFLSDTFSSLGDAFGSDNLKGIADGINVAMDAMNSTMQGAQAGSIFGPIGTAAGAAIGLVSSLATSIAKIHDKKNEKNIERLQDQIDVLDDSYNKLAHSIEKAYSTDASDLIDQQNELLEQQKLLIQQQILEEKDKKKTDDGRIKEWERQLKDIDEQIQDNVEKAQEAIAGISFDSFRSNFLDSLTDMDAKVEDLADNFEEYLKKAILNGLMADKYDSQIKELYEKWTAYGKNGLTEAEVEQLRKDYKDIANAMIADRDSLAQIYGWESETTKEQQSASSRGFGSEMTHEDASELSGRFTAVYESNLRIEAAEQQQTVAITELRGSISALTAQASGMYNIADETRTILANSYLELQQIRENTGEIVKPIKQMQIDMAEVKRNTSRL